MTDTPIPLQSILALVRYLECDERKDFEARRARDRKNHIYNHVKAVSDWLDGQKVRRENK
jgi:hypothetical protein